MSYPRSLVGPGDAGLGAMHRGPRGYTNLAVSTVGGDIVLDPHATGECGFTLDEAAAAELFDALGEWLGLEGRQ